MLKTITASALALTLLTACSGQVENAADKAAAKVTETAAKTADAASSAAKTADAASSAAKAAMLGADISKLPAGTYKSESGHAYIAFSYYHQGYSRPILRWGEFDSTVTLNSENPESSAVNTVIKTASIDSGVKVWNEHLVEPDWFDAANYPEITFVSTDVDQSILGGGKLTGDLTIKDVTKPITFDVTLNKVGQHFRSKKSMFGISATSTINRSDYGITKYSPTGEEVKLMLEIEFIKED